MIIRCAYNKWFVFSLCDLCAGTIILVSTRDLVVKPTLGSKQDVFQYWFINCHDLPIARIPWESIHDYA